MSHSTVRLGNGELDAVAELPRVNLSPENRFEASPLRGEFYAGNSTGTGDFPASPWRACAQWPRSLHGIVQSGGLVSYGPSLVASQRRGAEYVDKIFKSAKPADMKVTQVPYRGAGPGAPQPKGFGESPASNPAARPASVSSYVYRSRDLILIQRFSTALFNPR